MNVVHEELHHQANHLRTLESTNTKCSEGTPNECGFERAETWFGKENAGAQNLGCKAGRREREDWYLLSFRFITVVKAYISFLQDE